MPKGCIVTLAQRHTLLRAIMPLATAFVKTATALQLVSSMTLMSVASLSWAGAFPSASPVRARAYSLSEVSCIQAVLAEAGAKDLESNDTKDVIQSDETQTCIVDENIDVLKGSWELWDKLLHLGNVLQVQRDCVCLDLHGAWM